MKYVIMLLIMFGSATAKAEDISVLLGGWSDHVITDSEYNESHKATLIEYGSYMVGRFQNSYGRNTWTAAYSFKRRWGDFEGSIHVGLMYGYRGCFNDFGKHSVLCPMVYPSLTYVKYRFQPQIGLLGEAVVFIVRVDLTQLRS